MVLLGITPLAAAVADWRYRIRFSGRARDQNLSPYLLVLVIQRRS